jgi:hypothetical protein
MKAHLFIILLNVLTIGSNSFTTRKANKPFVSQSFYYISGRSEQRIEPGYDYTTIPFDPPEEYSITSFSFRATYNWQSSSYFTPRYTSGDGSSYVYSFNITQYDANTDFDESDGISLQQALDAIFNYYTNTCSYPTNISVDTDGMPGGVMVTNITRAEDAH